MVRLLSTQTGTVLVSTGLQKPTTACSTHMVGGRRDHRRDVMRCSGDSLLVKPPSARHKSAFRSVRVARTRFFREPAWDATESNPPATLRRYLTPGG